MKRIVFFLGLMFLFAWNAYAETYVVEIIPTTATYEQRVESGLTVWQRRDTVHRINDTTQNNVMSFSGTSPCQVIDLTKMDDIDGYFTFQFKDLSGITGPPLSGTTINAYFRVSNIDSPAAWVAAVQTPIFTNLNAYTGTTNVGYDMNDISGVTDMQFLRLEFVSGVSSDFGGLGNLRPTGLLHIR